MTERRRSSRKKISVIHDYSVPSTNDTLIGFDNSHGRNNCWLNTVIRVLAHMIEHAPEYHYVENVRDVDLLVGAFIHYIKEHIVNNLGRNILCVDDKEISIRGEMISLKYVVGKLLKDDAFNTDRQHDVHEALIGIIDVVPHFIFCKYEYHMERTCSQCSFTSGTIDSLDHILSVSVPNNSFIHFEMQKAINDTILESRETDMICRGCNRETISEKMTLKTLPQFLIIHLILFNNNLQKLENITIPPKEIQLRSSHSQNTYELHCIIEHIGPTMEQGHYVCYFLKNDKWFRASDNIVQHIGESDLPTQPYVSVYKKRINRSNLY